MTLCAGFREISLNTTTYLALARAASHQPLEESITDNNVLWLRAHYSAHVITHTFTRRQERRTGADWEWWFLDKGNTTGLCMRVQAKVLNIASGAFKHLHYMIPKTTKYQVSVLRREARKSGAIPIYCLYLQDPAYAPKFGCSVLSVDAVSQLQRKKAKNLASVGPLVRPLEELACPGGTGSASGVPESPAIRALAGATAFLPKNCKPRIQPIPHYVDSLLGPEVASDNSQGRPGLGGILVFPSVNS